MDGRRLAFEMRQGLVWWRLVSFLTGLCLVSACGLVLVGAWMPALLMTVLAWAVWQGLTWPLRRRRS